MFSAPFLWFYCGNGGGFELCGGGDSCCAVLDVGILRLVVAVDGGRVLYSAVPCAVVVCLGVVFCVVRM